MFRVQEHRTVTVRTESERGDAEEGDINEKISPKYHETLFIVNVGTSDASYVMKNQSECSASARPSHKYSDVIKKNSFHI